MNVTQKNESELLIAKNHNHVLTIEWDQMQNGDVSQINLTIS